MNTQNTIQWFSITVLCSFVALSTIGTAYADPCISIGSPQNGALMHPKKLKDSRYLNVRRGRNYGTQTLVDVVESAIEHVHRHHPETPKLYVGDVSDADGGHLGRHMSHQSGRDADIGYFRDGPLHEEHRLIATKPKQLDLYRNWTFIAFLLDHPKVQAIYSDKSLIQALHMHAQSLGHSQDDLRRWFGNKVGAKYSGSKLRHWDGHTTHIHLRVRSDAGHRTWKEMAGKLDAKTFTFLKKKTSPRTKKALIVEAPRPQAPTVAQLSTPPQITRRHSSATSRARNRAKNARLKARLVAAQARAQRRRRLGMTAQTQPMEPKDRIQEEDSIDLTHPLNMEHELNADGPTTVQADDSAG